MSLGNKPFRLKLSRCCFITLKEGDGIVRLRRPMAIVSVRKA